MKAQLVFPSSKDEESESVNQNTIDVSVILPKGVKSDTVNSEGRLVKCVFARLGEEWKLFNPSEVNDAFCYVSKGKSI